MKADLENEIRMLQGNINRMCIADDIEELNNRREWAIKGIEIINSLNLERLNQKNKLFKKKENDNE